MNNDLQKEEQYKRKTYYKTLWEIKIGQQKTLERWHE